MPTPIQHQPPAILRAACVISAGETPASIPARHFAWARMKSDRGQAMNHTALAHLPRHSALRADLPRPTQRSLHLISDRTGERPKVAAILAARMSTGQHIEGGAA